jgi:molybdenum cofactor synthesis domain-containing protein
MIPAASSPQEAVRRLLVHAVPVDTERVPLSAAAGRVLAEPVIADRPSPPADVSAMDGYAVRLADLRAGEAGGVRLRVAAEVRIGHAPPPLPPVDATGQGARSSGMSERTKEGTGIAVRIVTGGAVPVGADLVLPREQVDEGHPGYIVVPPDVARSARAGAAIRRRGENAPAGAFLVPAGHEVTPAVAGALASVGNVLPLVRRRVRVGIVTTGDELIDAASGVEPGDFRLRDSNGPALAAMLATAPWIEIVSVRRVPDDPDAIAGAAGEMLGEANLLFLTGGVSMGDRDFVPGVLARLGATAVFHKVPQRPGRPVLGAVTTATPPARIILALPGNPVSVLATARRLGAPVLHALAGRGDWGGDRCHGDAGVIGPGDDAGTAGSRVAPSPPPAIVTLVNADTATLDLWWFRLVRLAGPGRAELVEGRGSGDIAAAARADGFIEVPPGATRPGPWPYYPWSLGGC